MESSNIHPGRKYVWSHLRERFSFHLYRTQESDTTAPAALISMLVCSSCVANSPTCLCVVLCWPHVALRSAMSLVLTCCPEVKVRMGSVNCLTSIVFTSPENRGSPRDRRCIVVIYMLFSSLQPVTEQYSQSVLSTRRYAKYLGLDGLCPLQDSIAHLGSPWDTHFSTVYTVMHNHASVPSGVVGKCAYPGGVQNIVSPSHLKYKF